MVFIKKDYFYFLLFLSSCFLSVEARSASLPPSEASQTHKEGRQGILEIPKQAATIIRKFIDQNLHTYLNIPTPTPSTNSNVPPEIGESIVGNFLLGNFYATPGPAPPFTQELVSQQTDVKPVFGLNQAIVNGQTPNLVEITTAAVTAPTPTPPPSPSLQAVSSPDDIPLPVSTKKPKVKPNQSPDNVHILETDAFGSALNNPYGLVVNNNNLDNDKDVYWIPDATRRTVVIPIQTSTTQQTTPATEDAETETSPVETTTEEEEEEGSFE